MLHTLSLDGAWKAKFSDGTRGRTEYANRDVVESFRYIDATVPGDAHLDAMAAGLIADTRYGLNSLSARWVEEVLWSYRREFDAPAEAIRQRTWLVFESLDLVATVFLNGQEVGRHNNVFYPCRIDVTGKLRPGNNVLTVNLDSGLYDVASKTWTGYDGTPDTRLTKRRWLRKPQCQFNWDWATRLINVGIPRPVRLEWTDAVARLDQLVPLVHVSDDLKKATVTARLFVEGLGAEPIEAELHAELPGLNRSAKAKVQIKAGLNPVEATVTIDNPPLWWPVGQGRQTLHELKVTLSAGGTTLGERSATIGFRKVVVNQDKHPVSGRYFNFEINNRKIFCKGGNFVPADMIFARINAKTYESLTDLALESNFNMLRIWGGGLYEADEFYDMCDRKGILVWQEFIFACDRYPATEDAFHTSVKAEAVYNIRRLAGHASLVAWCGNNEIEMGYWEWGFDKGTVMPDHQLFHHTLPRLMAQEDPTVYYQPSSPFSPDHLSANRDDVGDQHPWSIGFGDTDFRKYRAMISRFPNEGGILGPTSLPTMLACLPEAHQTTTSIAWQHHDNSIETWGEPAPCDVQVINWIGKDPRKLTVEQFAYWAGLVQGEGLRQYIDNFRRRMYDTGSAIFWMYNDYWPATRSWTTIDYFHRRTPAFHPVRRAMAPIYVVLAEQDGRIDIFGVNDSTEVASAELRFGVFTLAGEYKFDDRKQVRLEANTSKVIASMESAKWTDDAASMPFAVLAQGGKTLARNRYYRKLFKEMTWPKAEVRVSLKDGKAIFECSQFAWNICIDLNGDEALGDNFFDAFPGQPYAIDWKQAAPPKILHIGNLVG